MSSDAEGVTNASNGVALERLTAAFMRLLSEHWVQAEKLENLIQLLARHKLVDPGDLELIGRDTENDADRDHQTADFVRRILDPLREPGD
jgi:hypothetical protein